MSVLSKPYFHDEEAAFSYLESIVWTNGATCPHCGGVDRISKVKANPEKRIRVGLWRCGDCKKQFTVKIGTVFEHMRIPLHKALQAVYLMTSSKKGISAHQLHRVLEITYKSAWFLCHRIREAMRDGDLAPFGGNGGIVEVDETFIGKLKGVEKKRAFHHKMKVLALVDRDTGKARTMVVDNVKAETLMPIVIANVSREARIMTDEHSGYRDAGKFFAGHSTTSHGRGEYVNLEDRTIHSNTVEGYFSIFKRGMKGIYQHCGEQHLHRYLAEFEFRYNNREALGCNDKDRSVSALSGIVGKRLTYRRFDGVAQA
ncbi:IS1595 family transposase [Novosphingobium mangrovi (ex Huang et al. 2023)]|uniref:IS1595 family transposase n=1 Tax=Novosphingobium mangrovi (ex Huang et al. 2023) TaxID=2976432 RepID=A0ABT2IA91_9SPHN|nr:IS1595 family transposase [Novosphingobium mangrovi (ex Huang et al. 2023)]MCT2401718.1 IS1595 family transposase [Novosphingobium mangrovi (ex Huang et al. 2023)]